MFMELLSVYQDKQLFQDNSAWKCFDHRPSNADRESVLGELHSGKLVGNLFSGNSILLFFWAQR